MILPRSKFLKLIIISVFTSIQAHAQNPGEPSLKTTGVELIRSSTFNKIHNVTALSEDQRRAIMRADGLPDAMIEKYIAQRRLLLEKEITSPAAQIEGQNPIVPFAACGTMGGESGWGAWKGDVGTANNGSQTWTPPAVTPTAPNFALTTGGGTDPCTPGTVPGNPPLPLVAGGNFGNTSILIGDPQQSGSVAEQLSFPLTVTAADTNFIYAYAIVVEDAGTGHTVGEQPFVSLCIYDKNGNAVPCGCFKYTGGPNLPGFFQGSCNILSTPYYKPWTTVGVNLSNYVGQTLTVTITNVDCAQGAHFAHSYWDFMCPPVKGTMTPVCKGQQSTICAPNSDPGNPYSYTWYLNGAPYTGTPNNKSQCITPFPQPGDTFAVHVHQASGCDFWVPFVPEPMSITPAFTYTSTCGVLSFSGTAVTNPTGGAISNWAWDFGGGGTPNTSTSQNPTGISFSPGTYTVTLIATSQNGCKDTVKLPVVATGPPVGSFTFTAPSGCNGGTVTFNGTSVPSTGATYLWDFGDGGTSTQQNPSHFYANSGTYTITMTASLGTGCLDTVVHVLVISGSPPVSVPTGINVCFNNASVFTDQSIGNTVISNWKWDFGDGNTSTSQNPTHTYGSAGTYTVTLEVTNSSGCKDTNKTKVVVHPLPAANFSSVPVCLGNPTCFKDLSNVTPGTVTGWSWNFGDPASGAANTSSQQNPCHTYNGNGPYTVILTATSDSGCQNTIMLPATTHPLPTAGIVPKNVCVGSSTTISDGSTSPAGAGNNINTWDWDFGDGSPHSNQQNPSHVYNPAGTYTMTLIVTTANGCKDTTTNTVQIYHPPVANFTKPASGCSPVYANYTDISTSVDGTISSWQWTFPGGTPVSSTDPNPSNIKYVATGTYSVNLVVTSSHGCIDNITLPMVEVYPWPDAQFCVAPSVAPTTAPVFNFCDMWSNDVSQWVWDFGDGTAIDSINTDPVHSYSATANQNDFYSYTICLNVRTQHGCWDTVCHSVELIPEFTFYIPNTFTPNGDGTNDMFFGKCRGVKEYDIWLFDRWGNQVWDCHKDDKNTNWDNDATTPRQEGLASYCKWNGVVVRGGVDMGGGSGDEAQEDVYVWKVKLLDIFNKRHTYVGHVNIVR